MSNLKTIEEPKGIPFFSVKTGETHHAKLEAQISAYINSSDIGVNASRGQNYGWRIGAEWVQKIRDFKKNSTKMSILTSKLGGQKPTTVQIAYYMYGEELQAYYEAQEDNEDQYEEEYQEAIEGAEKKSVAQRRSQREIPKALQDFRENPDDDEEGADDDLADLIDSEILEDEKKSKPKATETEATKASKK